MCELLICPDDMSDDPTDARPRRGDVIAVMEDGHAWGAKEAMRFIRVLKPGEPAADYFHLLGNKMPEGCAPLYRAFYLDLVAMEVRRRETVPLVLEA